MSDKRHEKAQQVGKTRMRPEATDPKRGMQVMAAGQQLSRRRVLVAALNVSLVGAGCSRRPAVASSAAASPQASAPPRPNSSASSPAEKSEEPVLASSVQAGPSGQVQRSAQEEQSGPNLASADAQAGSGAALSCERIVALIGRNHGHVVPVSAEQVLAATTQTFALRGQADHPHAIEITAEEFQALGRGEVLRKKTQRGGANAHRHRVLLRCEPLVLPPELTNVCNITFGGKDDHELVIPESDVRGGQARSYDVQGVAGHTHELVLTPEHFASLIAGRQIDVTTKRGLGHFHHVYISYPLKR